MELLGATGPPHLLLRQQDVKRRWTVTLNDKVLGTLPVDEIDLVANFAVPPGTIADGENRLVVSTRDTKPDDIRLGHARLIDGRPQEAFTGLLRVRVVDDSGEPSPA